MQAVLGQKKKQTQKFREDGSRIPVTVLSVGGNVVTQVKELEKDGYMAVQIGFGTRKHGGKAMLGHLKKAGREETPRVIREIRLTAGANDVLPALGDTLKIAEVLKPGDIVKVTGEAKGKGFAGVVKRHHFRGGPRTHGQSDRERAPGSIGQTTTPGRVYRGKRMAGHMGTGKKTVTNLEVVDVNPVTSELLVKGLVPGSVNTIVVVEWTGEVKKFVPLIDAYKEEVAQEVVAEEKIDEKTEETKTEADAQFGERGQEVPAEEVVTQADVEETKTEEAKVEPVSEENKV